MNGGISNPEEQIHVQVTEIMDHASKDACNVNLTTSSELHLFLYHIGYADIFLMN